MTRVVGGLLLLLLLGACQQRITASVTRFYTLPPPPYNQTITILPEPNQAGDLEFQHVASQVAAALSSYGFRPVPPDGPPADYVVLVHSGPAGARQQIVDFGPPFAGPWWRHPYYYPEFETYTLYAQYLEVEMLDGPTWRRKERRMVFQGRAVAETGVREFNVVLPYLVQTLFKDFPGANGQTVRVTVPVK
ncbi:MAG TPA: DUF4136 domain-containing protein [Alphaproteobacteria bacterium]